MLINHASLPLQGLPVPNRLASMVRRFKGVVRHLDVGPAHDSSQVRGHPRGLTYPVTPDPPAYAAAADGQRIHRWFHHLQHPGHRQRRADLSQFLITPEALRARISKQSIWRSSLFQDSPQMRRAEEDSEAVTFQKTIAFADPEPYLICKIYSGAECRHSRMHVRLAR